jgi:hypothetical protein
MSGSENPIKSLKTVIPQKDLVQIIEDSALSLGLRFSDSEIYGDKGLMYRIEVGKDVHNESGVGGTSLEFIKLRNSTGREILRSYSFDQYTSNFDDSITNSNPTEFGTELYIDNTLGKMVFEEVRKRAEIRDGVKIDVKIENKKQDLKKYIVFYSERADGPQCNGDYVRLVESPVFPTESLLQENGMIHTGSCTNVSYPGCEDCGGSRIIDFRVEDYSSEKAKRLGLVDKLYGSEGIGSCLDNYLHRLTPDKL